MCDDIRSSCYLSEVLTAPSSAFSAVRVPFQTGDLACRPVENRAGVCRIIRPKRVSPRGEIALGQMTEP